MTYSEARQRLFSHSNLPSPASAALPADESLCFQLWRADRESITPNIQALAEDVLVCLEVANRLQRTAAAQDLAYSISGLIVSMIKYHRKWSRAGRFDQATRDSIQDALYRIAYAWDQLLAGDMDNLLEGFEFEQV